MAHPQYKVNQQKFQLKLIEMLGKGFKEKEHHDFVSDIEQSRAAYEIDKGDVEYFVMRALLSLPVIVTSSIFLTTLREVLEFYKSTLLKLMDSFIPKMECLRAIEDANWEFDHLKIRESSAFLVHYLTQAGVLDGDTVLQIYNHMLERNSYLTTQESFRMMITWLRDEAAKRRQEQSRAAILLPEDEVDKPLGHQLLMNGIKQNFNVKPLCFWTVRPQGRNTSHKYKPLLVWVTKKAEEVSDDTDEQSDEDENPIDDDAENENEDVNPEQNYGEEEQSDIEDQDDDEEDDFIDSDGDDVQLHDICQIGAKNMMKTVRQ